MNTILTILFFFIAGCFNGLMDKLKYRYSKSIFARLKTQQFWNPEKSWKNRYKDADGGDYRERFPLSKTMLSFLFSGWHLFKEGMWSSVSIAITILLPQWRILEYTWANEVIQFLIVRTVIGIGFYSTYKYSFNLKAETKEKT